MSLIEKLSEVYAKPNTREFAYEIGQIARVKKTLEINVHAVLHLLGTKGEIVNRGCTGIHKEHIYTLEFQDGSVEEFDETELDHRYIKKKKK